MKRPTLGSLLLPTAAIRRAVDALSHTRESLGKTVEQMKDSLPSQTSPGKYPEDDVRSISDSRQRFETMYEMHRWNEVELAEQIRITKRTKIVALVICIVSMVGALAFAIRAPMWLSVFMIPVTGSLLILGFAQSFKYALYEAQMNLREFISAREFLARNDFWQRFLG